QELVSPSQVNRNVKWLIEGMELDAGLHQEVARVHSDPRAEVVLGVFSDFVNGHEITVGPSGGEFNFDGGVSVSIPPGAVPNETAITIRIIEPSASDPALGPIVSLGPQGTKFDVPIHVSAPL